VRSRIVLRCAEGGTIEEVAAELGVSRDMVSKWRRRFLVERLEGLSDEPRPGRPRTIGDDLVEQVITKTLEERPSTGDSQWSTRSMAAATGMSQSSVSRIWRAFLNRTWCRPRSSVPTRSSSARQSSKGSPRHFSRRREPSAVQISRAPTSLQPTT
jgi:transposase